MRVIVVKWKRIESQKKELATHNSFEKELKESILQLSTPESLPLYSSPNYSGPYTTKFPLSSDLTALACQAAKK